MILNTAKLCGYNYVQDMRAYYQGCIVLTLLGNLVLNFIFEHISMDKKKIHIWSYFYGIWTKNKKTDP